MKTFDSVIGRDTVNNNVLTEDQKNHMLINAIWFINKNGEIVKEIVTHPKNK
jgi:hypothetical protein